MMTQRDKLGFITTRTLFNNLRKIRKLSGIEDIFTLASKTYCDGEGEYNWFKNNPDYALENRFADIYAPEGGYYNSPIENPKNMENIEGLLAELEDFERYIKNIREDMIDSYEKEQYYLDNANTAYIVQLVKQQGWGGSSIECGLYKYDVDSNEILETVDREDMPWDRRSDITEKMLNWNEKYGVNIYESISYEPTAKVLKVYHKFGTETVDKAA